MRSLILGTTSCALILVVFQNCQPFEAPRLSPDLQTSKESDEPIDLGPNKELASAVWHLDTKNQLPAINVYFDRDKSASDLDVELNIQQAAPQPNHLKIKLNELTDFLEHAPQRISSSSLKSDYDLLFLNKDGSKILAIKVTALSLSQRWQITLTQNITPLDFNNLTMYQSGTKLNLQVGSNYITQIQSSTPSLQQVVTCGPHEHAEDNVCVGNKKSCTIVNGTAQQTWDGSSYGTCTLVKCDTGYTQSANTCILNCSGNIAGSNTNKKGSYYDLTRINKNFPAVTTAFTCPSLPAVPSKFDPPTSYSSDGLTPNPAFATHMKPFLDFANTLNRIGDEYLEHGGDLDIAKCLSRYADAWSASGLFTEYNAADLGRSNYSTTQGDYERVYMVLAVTLNMLKIKDAAIDEARRKRIISWMQKTMQPLQAFYTNRIRLKTDGTMERPELLNNHQYWAGLATFAYGILGNSQEDRNYGLKQYQLGVESIRNDGTLKTEMDRGPQAFIYHQYALQPLMLFAELRSIQLGHTDTYQHEDSRLFKLTNLIKRAYTDKAFFDVTFPGQQLQTPESMITNNPYYLDWMEIYHSRFKDNALVPLIKAARASKSGMNNRRMGGRMDLHWGLSNCKL